MPRPLPGAGALYVVARVLPCCFRGGKAEEFSLLIAILPTITNQLLCQLSHVGARYRL